MTEETRRAALEALRKRQELTVEERWQDMVDRGVIDQQGNVLLPARAPYDRSKGPKPETISKEAE